MNPRRPYRTDLSDARWALIEPILTQWRADRVGLGIKEPIHDLREIVNAILWMNRAGCAWEMLPHDFPPYKSVYAYFAAWAKDGTTEKIHDLLRGKVRERAGRAAEPTAAIVDAQAVKTSSNVPEAEQGVDVGKQIRGRKRSIAVDTLGLLLVVVITAASVQDTNAGKTVVDHLAAAHPGVSKGWADSGYKTGFTKHAAAHGIEMEIVRKEPGQKGFKVLPRRWVVERTLGWLMLHRRLVRDYEARPEHSRSMIHWAMIDNMDRRLTGENTPSWRNNSLKPGELPAT
jgi:transposase